MKARIGSINIGVRDLDQAVAFYRDVLGFGLVFSEPSSNYARFDVEGIRLGVISHDAGSPEADAFTGRHTGISIAVDDVDRAYEELKARGASFPMAPTRQPWGAYMAMVSDPDGNLYYLETFD